LREVVYEAQGINMDVVKLCNKPSIVSDKRRAVEIAGTSLESAGAESFIQVNYRSLRALGLL
jgi:hypothetical protein